MKPEEQPINAFSALTSGVSSSMMSSMSREELIKQRKAEFDKRHAKPSPNESQVDTLMRFDGVDPMEQILRHQQAESIDALYVPRSKRLAMAQNKITNPDVYEKLWFVYTYIGTSYAEPFEFAAFAMSLFLKKEIYEEFKKDESLDDPAREKVREYLSNVYEKWFPRDGWREAFLERTDEKKRAQNIDMSSSQKFLFAAARNYISYAELIRQEAATMGLPGPYPPLFNIWDVFDTQEEAEEHMRMLVHSKDIDIEKIAVGTAGCYLPTNPKYQGKKNDFSQADIARFYGGIKRKEEMDKLFFLSQEREKTTAYGQGKQMSEAGVQKREAGVAGVQKKGSARLDARGERRYPAPVAEHKEPPTQ